MAFDPSSDARRVRVAFLVAAVTALGALLVGGLAATRTEWRGHQASFVAAGLDTESPGGIVELRACDGTIDRCTTCHVGIARIDLVGRANLSPPLAAHPTSLEKHSPHQIGCSACHGGTGRALEASTAHAMPGTRTPDPLLASPYIQASCARCHVPGIAGTERLARGADLYLRLGCAMCHSLSAGGRGGWDYGPNLRGLGRQSLAYLETSLLEPTANFPGSTMPTYQSSFRDNREALDDLLTYLLALSLEPACPVDGAGDLVNAACSSCHAGEGGRAVGRMEHLCSYIQNRKAELSCPACHQAGVPEGAASGFCPVVREHRGACDACHAARRP